MFFFFWWGGEKRKTKGPWIRHSSLPAEAVKSLATTRVGGASEAVGRSEEVWLQRN